MIQHNRKLSVSAWLYAVDLCPRFFLNITFELAELQAVLSVFLSSYDYLAGSKF